MFSLQRSARTDNLIFTLHYRYTVLLLVFVSFVITCRLLAGDSFTCTARDTQLSPSFVNYYCYSNGTFIDLSYWGNSTGRDVPYRGIGQSQHYSNRLYVTYYKWVNLILLLQAFWFYFPRLIWKAYENGLILQLTAHMDLYMNEVERSLSLCILAKYLVMMQGKHKFYACTYILCELLNHVIALIQIVCLVNFFQITGVPDSHSGIVLNTWRDFEDFYFPRVSQCLVYHYDKSGVVETDALCSLPLNNYFMHNFLFLYSWYIFLAVMSGGVLVYRTTLSITQVRTSVTKLNSALADPGIVSSICSRSSFADWFVLSRIQKNLLPSHFAELIKKLRVVSQCCEEMDSCEKLIANQMHTTSFSTEVKD